MSSPVSPISVLSAVLLAALLAAFATFASMVIPPLGELLRTEPRLAMLGFLGVAISPAVVIAIAHHFGSGILGAAEKLTASRRRGLFPDAQSWSAGAHGWLVLIGASVLTNLVLMVLNPPKLEPEGMRLASVVTGLAVTTALTIPSAIWVAVATIFFELQRRSQRDR